MMKKKWTLLFYLNGNNDLGLEMESTFLDLCNSSFNDDINIVIEIGKAPLNIVKMVRLRECYYKEDWSGVRRYAIINNSLKLEEILENKNMADYKELNDFISWGMKEFPAERYLVSISGHGFIVASLSDLCSERPYIMGLYEMTLALNTIKEQNIDILILDICNMNTVETLYELGSKPKNPVKNLLTYVGDGPLEGISYGSMIKYLNDDDTKVILNNMVSGFNYNLVALDVNHSKLKKLKTIVNEFSFRLLNKEISDFSYYDKMIQQIIDKLVICHKAEKNKKTLLNLISAKDMNDKSKCDFFRFYKKLAFLRNNYWWNIAMSLDDKGVSSKLYKPTLEYLDCRQLALFILLYNETLTFEEAMDISKTIFIKLNWINEVKTGY